MSGGGSQRTAGSGNGNPPKRYTCDATDWYLACRQRIEELCPRIRQIALFDQLEALVQLFAPQEYAQRMGGGTWLTVTQEGANVPEIDVLFTFTAGHVRLQAAFVDI